MINAPMIVIVTTALLIVLHAVFALAPAQMQNETLYQFGLLPMRFWAPAGSPNVYPDAVSGLLTLLSSGLLHGDWMHVIFNGMMILIVGAPVARALGPGARGASLWMLLFVASIIAGSVLFLAINDVNGPFAIGASGGASGLFAASFLLSPEGGKVPLWSRRFIGLTLAFAAVNVVLAFGGSAVGSPIAWESHAGGYIAGALLMALIPVRGYGWTRS